MKTSNVVLALLLLTLCVIGCTTRIYQTAGRDASVSISTTTAVQPSTAIGNNSSASVVASEQTSKE